MTDIADESASPHRSEADPEAGPETVLPLKSKPHGADKQDKETLMHNNSRFDCQARPKSGRVTPATMGDEGFSGSPHLAPLHATTDARNMAEIRRRVLGGAYDSASVADRVARRIFASGDIN